MVHETRPTGQIVCGTVHRSPAVENSTGCPLPWKNMDSSSAPTASHSDSKAWGKPKSQGHKLTPLTSDNKHTCTPRTATHLELSQRKGHIDNTRGAKRKLLKLMRAYIKRSFENMAH